MAMGCVVDWKVTQMNKKKKWCGYVESDDDGYEQDNCKKSGERGKRCMRDLLNEQAGGRDSDAGAGREV